MEEVAKIEECCMRFLKDGERQIEKLKEIILLENHSKIPTKEYAVCTTRSVVKYIIRAA